jgi:hypothetical protein
MENVMNVSSPILAYVDDEEDTACIRPLTEDDHPVYEHKAPEGTLVVAARYDSGVCATLVDLKDLLRVVAEDYPELLREAIASIKP